MSKFQAIAHLLKSAQGEVRRFEALVAGGDLAVIKSEPQPEGLKGRRGGGYPLPRKGRESLAKIADKILGDGKWRDRIPLSKAYETTAFEFAAQCIEASPNIDEKFAEAFLATTSQNVGNYLETRRYFFPVFCLNEEGQDLFEIGPVRFQRTNRFFSGEKERWEASVAATLGQATSGAQRDAESARYAAAQKHFSEHRWMASVNIENLEPSIAREVAMDVIDYACSLLRLVGPAGTAFVGLADFSSRRPEQISLSLRGDTFLARMVESDIDIHVSRGTVAAIKAIQGLDQIEIALGKLAAGETLPGPYERLLTALRWHSEAWKDPHTNSRLVKFVFSLEGLLMTGNKEGLSEQLAERVAMLLHDDFDARKRSFLEIRKLYDYRSSAVHGGGGSDDELSERERQSEIAAKAAGDCICAFAQLCPYLAGDVKAGLKAFFEALKLGGRQEALKTLAVAPPGVIKDAVT